MYFLFCIVNEITLNYHVDYLCNAPPFFSPYLRRTTFLRDYVKLAKKIGQQTE